MDLVKRLGGDIVYPKRDGSWYTEREQKQPEWLMAEEEVREPGDQKSFGLSSWIDASTWGGQPAGAGVLRKVPEFSGARRQLMTYLCAHRASPLPLGSLKEPRVMVRWLRSLEEIGT